MAHAQKIKKQGVIGLIIHCERREGCELSNQDIDQSRTRLNYNFACDIQPMKPEQFLKKRINEVKHINRNDVVYMVDWIVTLPKDVPPEDTERFFEITYQFLENKYKKENVVSAWVHNDETTPHLHFSFIPIVEIDGIERLKCKDVLTKKELKRFHPDLGAYLEQSLGYMPSIQNNATINGNRTVQELKQEEDLSLKKTLHNLHKSIEVNQAIIDESHNIDFNPSGLLEKTRTLKKCNDVIDKLKHSNKQYQKDVLNLSRIVTVQKQELDAYRQMPLAKQLKEREQVINNLYQSIDSLENQIYDYEKDNQILRDNNHCLDNKVDKLKNDLSIFQTFISWLGLEKIFQKFKKMLIHNDYEIDIKSFKDIGIMVLQKVSKKVESITNRIAFLESLNKPTNEMMKQNDDSHTIKNIIR